ncbi:MAG TPA: bifunctional pyr operon transcriptional regulator/uracil phosphoribosyltransferase PyrR, partial [Lacunisphaera sp.]|nr:bifunctional pyr operon transcriptional regulator/uracil phosphoribosyltransferase PyrR [Lacunisphaera sp.]
GRPTRVELAVLVDRGGRRLPVAADYTGLTITAGDNEKVVVNLDANAAQDSIAVLAAVSNRKS